MRVKIVFLSLLAALLFCSSACRKEINSDGKIFLPEDLNNSEYVVGVPQGAAAMLAAENFYTKAKILYYNSLNDGYTAVSHKKINAFVFDRHNLDYVIKANDNLAILPVSLGEEHIVVGISPNKKNLVPKINEFIKKYRADGTYQDMYKRWFSKNPPPMPEIKEAKNPEISLYVGTEGLNEPMNFFGKDGELTGFDLEFIKRLALFMNAKITITAMTYDALIPAVEVGKIDILIANTNKTSERAKKISFSDDYIDSDIAVLVHKDSLLPLKEMQTEEITSLSQLKHKRLGILTGSSIEIATEKEFPEADMVHVNTFNDLIILLTTGKIDGFMMEEPQTKTLLATNPLLKQLGENISNDDYAFAFYPGNKHLCNLFSEQIRLMKKDGTLKRLEDKWLGSDEEKKVMSKSSQNAPNGKLTFATVPQFEPFTYVKDGKVVGYDIETAYLAAERLGYSLEPLVMEWGGYIEAVAGGRVTFGASLTTVTPERAKMVCFAEPNYKGGLVMIVLKNNFPADKGSSLLKKLENIGKEIAASFERTFLSENRWKLILSGLEITILITICSAFFGTFLAFAVCFMRRSQRVYLSRLAKAYISLMQGMPILIILMLLYYIVFADFDMNAVVVAIIGFSLNFAAYAGEMMRTGIDSVDKGQIEAAKALGFRKFAVFRKIIFPQAARRILPVYRGEFINMLKMTSIVGYIAIQDLTKMSDIIRSRTYEAFFPLIATAIIYFLVAHLLASFLSYVEFHLNPENRKRSLKGVKTK